MVNSNYSKLFAALADPERFELFRSLISSSRVCELEGEDFVYRGNCVSNLVGKTSLSQPTISHHLKILEKAGLIYRKRKGKWIHFFVETSTLKVLEEFLRKVADSSEVTRTNRLQVPIPETVHFNLAKFSELISIIENHGFFLIQDYENGEINKVFLSGDSDQDQLFILTYKQRDTAINLAGINNNSSMVENKTEEIVALIEKYLPTLK